MIHEADIVSLRHDLRTGLNHMSGYCEILIDDAREYSQEELIPILQGILTWIGKLADLVRLYFEAPGDASELGDPERIKAELSAPLYEIISTTRDLRKEVSTLKPRQFMEDLQHVLTAANGMLDKLEEDLVPLFLQVQTPQEEEPLQLQHSELPSSARRTLSGEILLVDDNDLNRDMLSRHLSRQGHTVTSVPSGFEALERLKTSSFDLILLDVMMPGMSGYQLLKHLKEEPPFNAIPVIMISALEELDMAARCLELGAEDYLPKTFDPPILRARIEATLERKYLRDQERRYMYAVMEAQRNLERELADAAAYVRNLLPPRLTGAPVLTDWAFVPSSRLGGDCFGYHHINEDSFAFYLFDVSGHGIGAALLSVSVLNLLKSHGLPDTDFEDPTAVLDSLSGTFRMEEHNNMFFTLWYGVYHRKTRTLTYGAAGAPPGILFTPSREGLVADKLTTNDTLVGVGKSAGHTSYSQVLQPGARLYLFSDGAFEIPTKTAIILSIERFTDVLRSVQDFDTDRLDHLLARLRGLSVEESFKDDLSILELTFL